MYDDGRGFDAEQIRAAAIDKKLIDSNQQLTDQQVYRIVMENRLSTRAKVTNISGRGLGMNAVYSAVSEAGGKISVDSEKGQYSKVSISIPS